MKERKLNFPVTVSLVNILGGLFYLTTRFIVPQLQLSGGLATAAKGYPGFMVLVFSIVALAMLAINFGLFMRLATDGQPSSGPIWGLLAHGYAFLYIGAYYGVPSFIICLYSAFIIWRKNLIAK